MYIHKRVRLKTKKTRAYVNNPDFYEAIVAYQKVVKTHRREQKQNNTDQPDPVIPRYIGECIMLICNNLAKKPNFFGYSPVWKEEFVSDAIERSIMALKNFDPKKSSNPFAYFTQIAYNAFLFRLKKEKEQGEVKVENFERMYLLNEIHEEGSSFVLHVPRNEYMDEILRNKEERLIRKKRR